MISLQPGDFLFFSGDLYHRTQDTAAERVTLQAALMVAIKQLMLVMSCRAARVAGAVVMTSSSSRTHLASSGLICPHLPPPAAPIPSARDS